MDIYNHQIDITCFPTVFGDGNHETTRFLLYFLKRYAKGRTYIDCGCGTGILSIFASKVGAESVTAVDVDQCAIECATENIQANNAEVSIIHTDVLDLDITADIVTANFAREEALLHIDKIKQIGNIVITTWFKSLPTDAFADCTIIDHIEGIEYDCYVLTKEINK